LQSNLIAAWTAELETLRKSGGGQFDHAERLEQLRQRERELAEIMAKCGEEKQVLEGNDGGSPSD